MPEQGKVDLPASQKAPLSGPPSKTANAAANVNAPKTTSTGTVQNPQTGSTVKANESVNKTGVVTGDKKPPEDEKAKEETPQEKANREQRELAEEEENKPLEGKFSEIKGEVLQGDSFRISLTRGNKVVQIPVPLESTRDVITLDNTFKIISEVMNAKTEKEIDEKFHAFVKQ